MEASLNKSQHYIEQLDHLNCVSQRERERDTKIASRKKKQVRSRKSQLIRLRMTQELIQARKNVTKKMFTLQKKHPKGLKQQKAI